MMISRVLGNVVDIDEELTPGRLPSFLPSFLLVAFSISCLSSLSLTTAL